MPIIETSLQYFFFHCCCFSLNSLANKILIQSRSRIYGKMHIEKRVEFDFVFCYFFHFNLLRETPFAKNEMPIAVMRLYFSDICACAVSGYTSWSNSRR